MKILLDLQDSMRAVTLNSEFSLCGLIIITVNTCPDMERCALGCVLRRDPDNGCPVCQCEETGKPV